MSDAFDRICRTKEQAHEAARQGYAHAQAILSNGAPVRVLVEQQEDDRSVQQNRFYWGPVLSEISEQAVIEGQRWVSEAWHELFRRQFLGYEVVKVRVAGKKRPTIIRRLRSTTKLKVRAMGNYLDQVQAFAATDLGVRFSVPKWQEYQG
ncbi:recombination protein NinB [Rhizobacter sp. OV335]|uniref:recombination protein NinB n=1 Tax=Rhizobacter sp. OV335 TaxID=1500264 RepID=UPI0009229FF7|nr:recombination protein NinB [Rhizobacter sp. OV335]SHN40293.1 NinB protein [Rhizobacter sp. OV335]